ncbi:DMT family transporter [Chachezhania antarctica]|uniref:DMT family transporter n=1 Tax=Chachezhania antarctica TaxID=2340860 RepID=UPI000EAEED2F|nr:DMT family transporter [Chachezhania antarctica]|tara:strand:+ start:669 stop:1616 length:948 start_codon:yes stop_codon:yes gene_type:complete
MATDRPILGLSLMLAFCLIAPFGETFAKLLGDAVPIGQVVFLRYGMQAAMLIPLVWATGRIWRMRGRILRLTIIRTLFQMAGIATMFAALRYLPLADCIAIAFVMPFVLLLLGKLLLNETIGPQRLSACIVGFGGTLLVIQPSFVNIGWPALLPLGVAFTFSFFVLTTRQIAAHTDPISLQAVSGVMAVVLVLPALGLGAVTDFAPLQIVTPTAIDWTFLIGLATVGTGAHLLMTYSLKFAPSAMLAALQYIEIPVAALIGWFIFGDFPNFQACVGIVVTIGAGLYVMVYEHSNARATEAARVSETQPPENAQAL